VLEDEIKKKIASKEKKTQASSSELYKAGLNSQLKYSL
jgi:hypothetical protein